MRKSKSCQFAYLQSFSSTQCFTDVAWNMRNYQQSSIKSHFNCIYHGWIGLKLLLLSTEVITLIASWRKSRIKMRKTWENDEFRIICDYWLFHSEFYEFVAIAKKFLIDIDEPHRPHNMELVKTSTWDFSFYFFTDLLFFFARGILGDFWGWVLLRNNYDLTV